MPIARPGHPPLGPNSHQLGRVQGSCRVLQPDGAPQPHNRRTRRSERRSACLAARGRRDGAVARVGEALCCGCGQGWQLRCCL
jgi:hypothetical protein